MALLGFLIGALSPANMSAPRSHLFQRYPLVFNGDGFSRRSILSNPDHSDL
ncbi:hypothetical protein IC582_027607 [Cucumis melo]